jgi:hypothetical protein
MQMVKSRALQIPGNARTRAGRATAPQAVRPLLKKSDENYDCRTTFTKARRKFTISVWLWPKSSGNSKSQPEFQKVGRNSEKPGRKLKFPDGNSQSQTAFGKVSRLSKKSDNF